MNELFRVGLAMGLEMGGQGQELLKRIESFKKEVEEELGIEVKITVNIEIPGRKVDES